MTRLPQVSARDLVQFLKSKGFVETRLRGSHLILRNEMTRRTVTVPVHTGSDLGRGLAARIIKDAGFTVEDFANWR